MRSIQSGFTLVEMMIVLAVLMVVSAIAVPLYTDYTRTASLAAMEMKIELLRPFQDNWRFDNGSYLEGNYTPGGVNDFAAAGFNIPGDKDGISLEVSACAADPLTTCYRVLATNADGDSVQWERGEFTPL